MNTLTTSVEQALAFGRSLDWMREHLGVSPRFVWDVADRMDAINETVDQPETPTHVPELGHGTRAGYVAHQRRGDQACSDCLAAQRQYDRDRTSRRRASRREYDRKRNLRRRAA